MKGSLFAELDDGGKDIEIQPEFEPGSSESQPDALTSATGGLAFETTGH